MELTILKHFLQAEAKRAINMLNYLMKIDGCYTGAYVAYRILLTTPVNVTSAKKFVSS